MSSSKIHSLTLCLETGIAGGSVALFSGNGFVAGDIGEGSTSRSEDLLSAVEALLSEANTTASDIGRIAVSLGPGSFTGLRIGIATALGLSRAIGCEIVGIPLLPAMLSLSEIEGRAAVIPIGRADRAFLFELEESPAIVDAERLTETLSKAKAVIGPIELLPELAGASIKRIDTGRNLAFIIGESVNSDLAKSDLTPIYLQNPVRSRGLY